MSISALKQAVVTQVTDYLIEGGSPPLLPGAACQMMPSAEPNPAVHAPIFLSVHGGSTSGNVALSGADYLEETVGFGITISVRTAQIPHNHEGDYLDDLNNGLDTVERLIQRALLFDSGRTLLIAANALIPAKSASNLLVGDGIAFHGSTENKPQSARWWQASENSAQPTPPGFRPPPPGRTVEGYSRTLQFGGIRRFADDTDLTITL